MDSPHLKTPLLLFAMCFPLALRAAAQELSAGGDLLGQRPPGELPEQARTLRRSVDTVLQRVRPQVSESKNGGRKITP